MPTAQEYRKQAEQCVELEKSSRDLYAKEAMAELAEEFRKAADRLEANSSREHREDGNQSIPPTRQSPFPSSD